MPKYLSFLAFLMLLAPPVLAGGNSPELQAALDAQPEEARARYQFRHPGATLRFFGIEPGMTVVEALPGGGWYTKILLPYLGESGTLIGADYAADMWPLFGFFGEEFIAGKATWVEDWTAEASGWAGEGSADVAAFQLGSLPEDLHGQADAVLLIRALHNLARFEDQGGFLTAALAEAFAGPETGRNRRHRAARGPRRNA